MGNAIKYITLMQHHGSHTGDFRKRGPIYAFGAYIFRKRGVQSMKINDSGHTFCRLTLNCLRIVYS